VPASESGKHADYYAHWRGCVGAHGEGLLDRIHLRFFTLETIEELFASNGLRIERVFKKKSMPAGTCGF
jgi:hypothetical protein